MRTNISSRTYTKGSSLGFTMMELLVVIAMIGILGALGFAGFTQYQKSAYQREMDETAKEIYFAAQNHITVAENTGLLTNKTEGTSADSNSGGDTPLHTSSTSEGDAPSKYYFVVGKDDAEAFAPQRVVTGQSVTQSVVGATSTAAVQPILAAMLPYGSIDETIRVGGSYVIGYEVSSDGKYTVTDVFYASPHGNAFGGYAYTFTAADDYNTLESTYKGDSDEAKNARSNYKNTGAIIGWYGGKAGSSGTQINAPKITVKNAERLEVLVTKSVKTDYDKDAEIFLYVTGLSSKNVFVKKVDFELNKTEGTVVLDDITVSYNGVTNTNGHFADISRAASLWPGEDIEVQAVAMLKSKRSNLPMSAKVKTNSLFASIGEAAAGSGTSGKTVMVSNIRHLQNLDAAISAFGPSQYDATLDPSQKSYYSTLLDANGALHVEQIGDMSWTAFTKAIDGAKPEDVTIYTAGVGGPAAAGKGSYCPVIPSGAIAYDGKKFRISDVVISAAGNAGLFSELPASSSVSNLELTDFNVAATNGTGTPQTPGNAGALAGTSNGATIANVLVRNTVANDSALAIKGTGSVGGLVGSMTGGSVAECAAAVYVQSTAGAAGGLIGATAENATVAASYAGGHTTNMKYTNTANVQATSAGGGLIGSASATTVTACYATTSVSGATAGGLIGNVTNAAAASIADSYAVGRVFPVVSSGAQTNTTGGFVGSISAQSVLGTGNRYVEANNTVRTRDSKDKEIVENMKAVGAVGGAENSSTNANVADASSNTATYQGFVSGTADAVTYDKMLGTAYKNKYPMPSVDSLLGSTVSVGSGNFVEKHYGDWAIGVTNGTTDDRTMGETEVVNIPN